jgi:hypothetical protein
MGNIRFALDDVTARGVDVQLKFKGDLSPQPIGPGKLTWVDHIEIRKEDGCQIPRRLYKITAPATIQTAPNMPPRKISFPMIFDADDVLWISEGPLNAEDEPAIVTPGGNRTGGLHIPGR